MVILGINAYHGDAAAALLIDGQLVAAMEEERLSRIKHQAGFPYQAVRWCLENAGVRPEEVDHLAISRNPSAHLYKKILYALTGLADMRFLKSRLSNVVKVWNIREEVGRALDISPEVLRAELHHVEHHQTHLASTFFVSPFEKAALLSVDGFGDFVSTMWGVGQGRDVRIDGWIEFPHSLGVLYTAASQYLGFPRYGDEYKVMGLGAYGEPEFLDIFRRIVRSQRGKAFRLDLAYFMHHRDGTNMTWEKGQPELTNVFSPKMVEALGPSRTPGDPIDRRHEDVAASVQAVLEEAMFGLLNDLHDQTGLTDLCMAGGVAMNCVVNGKIRFETPFQRIYIQPAAYDAGTALGAALYVYHEILGEPRNFMMNHVYWGPDYDFRQIKAALERWSLAYREMDTDPLLEYVVGRLIEGKIVGWFQGRMEWGARALGNRSILVDPRQAAMKDILNTRIKHREAFRPFAPSILAERMPEYFEESHPSPFMLMAYRVRGEKRGQIPAVTHVDGTGRLQTVTRDENPLYWKLLRAFEKRTDVPVLLNTSFNENEPIVCSPEEAIKCFHRTRMDILVLGNFVVEKGE
ncbi:MAG: carbamoyltransferase [Candidatus Methylomirabilales bacterium]